MTNSVTNVEIEDVLSSIRRLVSDGDKLRADQMSGAVPAAPGKAADPAGEAPDEAAARAPEGPVRFVLTAAHRVETPDAANAQSDAEPSEPEASAAPEPDLSEIVWTSEDDTGDAAGYDTADVAEDDQEAQADTHIIADADPDDAGADGEVPDWVSAGEAELDAIEASTAEDEDAGETQDTPDAAHIGAAPLILEDAVAPEPEPEPEPDFEPEPEAAAPEAAPEAQSHETPPRSDRDRLAHTIAELEAAVGGQLDDWEPDGSEDAPVMDWDNAGEEVIFSSRLGAARVTEDPAPDAGASELRDEVDAEIIDDQPGRAAPAQAIAEAPDYDFDEDADEALDPELTAFLEQDEVLDEATLRQMVADIVREELQGPLGERITRNVRKMVRREIRLALAAEDFE